MLVVRKGAAVAECAQEVGEALAGRMEVEVANLCVAPVPEAVDDVRWHARERPRRHDDRLVLDAEPDCQLTLENIEEVAVHVQVSALATGAKTRPRRVQQLIVREDLDPPLGRVTDDLAAAEGNQDRLAHGAEV